MGLYGAFLTADLFNLFVFFEVLLAASYGLLLHGSGRARVRRGLHYIAINLFASSLFLIGAAMIYGVTGTLNMADLALKIPLVPEADRGLLHAGAAILAMAFLAKAGMWPLNFWLVPAYSSASAPVAAMFAIMTKVGVYTVLRLWTCCSPARPAPRRTSAATGWCMAAWRRWLRRAVDSCRPTPGAHGGLSILVSAGTLMAAMVSASRTDRRRAVLPGQLHPGLVRAVPAGRADRALALGQRPAAGRRRCDALAAGIAASAQRHQPR
jgi:multicomponent K+:H+ antiporter subunit D